MVMTIGPLARVCLPKSRDSSDHDVMHKMYHENINAMLGDVKPIRAVGFLRLDKFLQEALPKFLSALPERSAGGRFCQTQSGSPHAEFERVFPTKPVSQDSAPQGGVALFVFVWIRDTH